MSILLYYTSFVGPYMNINRKCDLLSLTIKLL